MTQENKNKNNNNDILLKLFNSQFIRIITELEVLKTEIKNLKKLVYFILSVLGAIFVKILFFS